MISEMNEVSAVFQMPEQTGLEPLYNGFLCHSELSQSLYLASRTLTALILPPTQPYSPPLHLQDSNHTACSSNIPHKTCLRAFTHALLTDMNTISTTEHSTPISPLNLCSNISLAETEKVELLLTVYSVHLLHDKLHNRLVYLFWIPSS